MSQLSSSTESQIERYVAHAISLLNLPVSSDAIAPVVENFKTIETIADPVLNFPLPDALEAAPRFEP